MSEMAADAVRVSSPSSPAAESLFKCLKGNEPHREISDPLRKAEARLGGNPASSSGKWSLLRSALFEGKRDHRSASSIHRFPGFSFVSKRKMIWCGFTIYFSFSAESADRFLSIIYSFLERVDCCECCVVLYVEDKTDLRVLSDFVASGELKHDLRVCEHPPIETEVDQLLCDVFTGCLLERRPTNFITVRVPHKTYKPRMRRCAYWSYVLPNEDVYVYTRETSVDAGLNTRSLLSNHLYGVDNTGNVCVWPTETIMLCALLRNASLTSMLANKRVIECGGGSTALAGVGLAALGIPAHVVVSDGHPDCVLNQVRYAINL